MNFIAHGILLKKSHLKGKCFAVGFYIEPLWVSSENPCRKRVQRESLCWSPRTPSKHCLGFAFWRTRASEGTEWGHDLTKRAGCSGGQVVKALGYYSDVWSFKPQRPQAASVGPSNLPAPKEPYHIPVLWSQLPNNIQRISFWRKGSFPVVVQAAFYICYCILMTHSLLQYY